MILAPGRLAMLGALFIGVSGCSTPGSSNRLFSEDLNTAAHTDPFSSIELAYKLQEQPQRIVLAANHSQVLAQRDQNGTVLEHGVLSREKYDALFRQVLVFVRERPAPASQGPASERFCRAPFTLTLRNDKDTLEDHGCLKEAPEMGMLKKLESAFETSKSESSLIWP